MTQITRRAALAILGAAAVPSAGTIAFSAKKAADLPATQDPIIDAIGRFRDGLKAYREYPLDKYDDDEDAIADRLFGQHEAVLINWDKPALTREGAAAALSIVQEETRFYADSPTSNAMLRAAIGYLESEVK